MPRVIVIGAGMAGLSAANHLVNRGIDDVVVLEARDRIGGRMFTCRKFGEPIELGAQWIHGGSKGNPVFDLAVGHGLVGSEEDSKDKEGVKDRVNFTENMYLSSGKMISGAASTAAAEIYGDIIDGAQDYFEGSYKTDRTRRDLSEYFESKVTDAVKLREKAGMTSSFLRELQSALNAYSNALAVYAGNDLDKLRLELFGSALEFPGGDVVVKTGLDSVVAVLATDLPECAIKLCHEVKKIDYSGKDQVKVDVYDGKTETKYKMEADYVICTIPIGVLQQTHRRIFSPELPLNKVCAMEHMDPGATSKLFLRWDRPWWRNLARKPEGFGLSLAWTPDEFQLSRSGEDWEKGIYCFNEVEGQPDMLMAWVVGTAARTADRLPDEEVAKKIGEVLRTFTGDDSLPLPTEMIRHKWTEDEFARGTYSHPNMGMEDEGELMALADPLPSAECPKLSFAGEAFHPEHWSTLQGARFAGIREAGRILDLHGFMN